jgi:hypothetical protein
MAWKRYILGAIGEKDLATFVLERMFPPIWQPFEG